MDHIDTSGKALIDHWKWAAEKNLMNVNTANALRAACSQVLSLLEGWETIDVRKIDVADVCRRFQNKRSKDFRPESLETYKRRFTQAVKLFLEYADNPSGWKAPFQDRSPRKGKNAIPISNVKFVQRREEHTPSYQDNGLVDYPFPLREGRIAHLRLPVDLKLAEVKRLNAYLTTLAVDFEPTMTT